MSRRPLISTQFHAHGQIARVARQVVKNELPDEFTALKPVLCCQLDVLSVFQRSNLVWKTRACWVFTQAG
jgi:hypothetical protein